MPCGEPYVTVNIKFLWLEELKNLQRLIILYFLNLEEGKNAEVYTKNLKVLDSGFSSSYSLHQWHSTNI